MFYPKGPSGNQHWNGIEQAAGHYLIARSMRPQLLTHICFIREWTTGYISFATIQWCSWWRHQIETSSALLAICAGNPPVPGEFPEQRPVTRSFDVFFDLRLNGRLSKQSWGWRFETPPRPLRRHSNVHERHGVSNPPQPPNTHPRRKRTHARIHFRKTSGNFSMGGANSRNQEKGVIFSGIIPRNFENG